MNKRIRHWEKGEHIESQKVIPLGHGKYAHVEIVDYRKKRKKKKGYEHMRRLVEEY